MEINKNEFPIVCPTCLGPNPYVRMQKFSMGGSCHISGRPYTVFRWKAGCDARYKKTVICHEVARLKNVCQVCMLDLDFNVPVQVRDHALNIKTETLPMSDAGKEYAINQLEANGELDAKFTKLSEDRNSHLLMKFARTEPYYKRNQSRICTFFTKGSCYRGIECPYRHESPINNEISKQNYHDRYYGVNDPVAQKMLGLATNIPSLSPPSDPLITTIFVGNITPSIKDKDIQEKFAIYGEILSIKMFYLKNCSYVKYRMRSSAEEAVSKLGRRISVNGQNLILRWGKPQTQQISGEKSSSIATTGSHISTELQERMGLISGPYFFNDSEHGKLYRAMNPEQFGSHHNIETESQKCKTNSESNSAITRKSDVYKSTKSICDTNLTNTMSSSLKNSEIQKSYSMMLAEEPLSSDRKS